LLVLDVPTRLCANLAIGRYKPCHTGEFQWLQPRGPVVQKLVARVHAKPRADADAPFGAAALARPYVLLARRYAALARHGAALAEHGAVRAGRRAVVARLDGARARRYGARARQYVELVGRRPVARRAGKAPGKAALTEQRRRSRGLDASPAV